jgi:hypothetical protein
LFVCFSALIHFPPVVSRNWPFNSVMLVHNIITCIFTVPYL